MKFVDYVAEKVDTNTFRKKAMKLNFDFDFKGRVAKDIYNNFITFLGKAPKLTGSYRILVTKNSNRAKVNIIDYDAASKLLMDYYKKINNPKTLADLEDWEVEDNFIRIMSDKKVLAGSLDLEKQIKNYWEIGVAQVADFHQNQGLMGAAYAHLITKENMFLMSSSQSPGARKMWGKLATMPGIEVMAYDEGGKLTLPLQAHGDTFFYTTALHYDPKLDFEPSHIMARAK